MFWQWVPENPMFSVLGPDCTPGVSTVCFPCTRFPIPIKLPKHFHGKRPSHDPTKKNQKTQFKNQVFFLVVGRQEETAPPQAPPYIVFFEFVLKLTSISVRAARDGGECLH